MQSFTCTGEFWIPGNEWNALEGTLSFDPRDGIELFIRDDPSTLFNSGRGEIIPCMHGKVKTDGKNPYKELTLYRILKYRDPAPASFMLFGGHFPEEANLRFKACSFSFLCSTSIRKPRQASVCLWENVTATVEFDAPSALGPRVTLNFRESQNLDECPIIF